MIKSYNEAIKKLTKLIDSEDYEEAHPEADDILMECLRLAVMQGWTIEQVDDILLTYDAVGKWYA